MAMPHLAALPQTATPRRKAPAQRATKAGTRASHLSLSQRAFIGVATICSLAMASQLAFNVAYAGRFLPGVAVANVQLGGLTRPEAQHALASRVAGYRFNISATTNTYTLDPADVGMHYNLNATLDEAYAQGRNQPWWPKALWQTKHSSAHLYALEVDRPKQQAFAAKLAAGSGTEAVDARIVVTNGVPAIQNEVNGRAISIQQVESALIKEIGTVSSARIALTPIVQTASIRSRDLAPAVAQTKQLIATPATITYQDKTFQPTAAQIGAWIGYSPNTSGAPGLAPKISPNAVKVYTATIARVIDVKPANYIIKAQGGAVSDQQAGQDGLALDQDALVSQVAAGFAAKKPLSLVAVTKPVAFQAQYNQTIITGASKYVEVDLAKQHMWAYSDHNVVYDSPITSGAIGAGYPTVTGAFSIQGKNTNRHLIGNAYGPRYNYDVFVHYWMPFSGGYGLHDASWRHGNFGGQDYIHDGSHGCVNLPDATATWLYNWTEVGTPVWVHA